jgi:hypothetical protein
MAKPPARRTKKHTHRPRRPDQDRSYCLLLDIMEELRALRKEVRHMDARITKLIEDFDAETTAIAAKIDALIAQGGSANADEIVAGLQPISDRLKALGSDVNNPIPAA